MKKTIDLSTFLIKREIQEAVAQMDLKLPWHLQMLVKTWRKSQQLLKANLSSKNYKALENWIRNKI